MAVTRSQSGSGRKRGKEEGKSSKPSSILSLDFVKSLIFDPSRAHFAGIALLLAEILLNVVIIEKVNYTEIDWVAYMQEVEGVIGTNGTYDYALLKGQTGPLVYPAGFVWLFSLLYYLTEQGTNIYLAQYIFLFFYIALLALVFRIVIKAQKLPPYALVFMSCLSYRIHSIFVLRLFNDPVAMLFLYAALNCFISDYWSLGSLFYSLAVSIKMNVLLFAPALFLVYLATQDVAGTVKQLSICASVQLLLAAPFLKENPYNYIKGSFDLGRVFLYKWTVNWRFVPEEIFLSSYFHIGLLLLHVILLLACAKQWWILLRSYRQLKDSGQAPTWSIQLLLLPLFMSNFIGVVFARSLHYQFYVWYFHQLHYLLWSCHKFPAMLKLLLLGVIEICWNTYPSTVESSGALALCHCIMLIGILHSLVSMANSGAKAKVV